MTKKRLLSLAVFAIAIVGMTSVAMANVPDETTSLASSGSGCVLMSPDATGTTLGSAGLTISVTVNDAVPNPIAAYPAQDISVGDDVGGVNVALCNGGSAADANTNAAGQTTISGVIAGGGNSQGMQVYIAGVALTGASLPITAVSSDFNRDLSVTAIDLSLVPGGFANLFLNGVLDWESDLTCDGLENLADLGRFAQDFLNVAVCP